jgi:hypothetical protein
MLKKGTWKQAHDPIMREASMSYEETVKLALLFGGPDQFWPSGKPIPAHMAHNQSIRYNLPKMRSNPEWLAAIPILEKEAEVAAATLARAKVAEGLAGDTNISEETLLSLLRTSKPFRAAYKAGFKTEHEFFYDDALVEDVLISLLQTSPDFCAAYKADSAARQNVKDNKNRLWYELPKDGVQPSLRKRQRMQAAGFVLPDQAWYIDWVIDPEQMEESALRRWGFKSFASKKQTSKKQKTH